MSTAAMQLTKKQRKALQFRGKLDKPEKTPEGEKEKEEREAKPKKPKADKKRKAKDAEIEEAETAPKEKKKFERQVNPSGNAVRFIAFVGNVPFKTTAQELQEFLKAANPTSVRLMTDKDTGKSRGFAFVDFSSSADLKHALKFHHMTLGTKKINVELTAGGGGNSNMRKEKLQRRREDLDKERRKDGVSKRQKTGPREGNAEPSEASERSAPSSSRSESAPAPAPAPAKREARVEQDINDYDDGSSKSKKPNRRKRGRGARK